MVKNHHSCRWRKPFQHGGPFSCKALDVLSQVMTLDTFAPYVSFPLYSTFLCGLGFDSRPGLCESFQVVQQRLHRLFLLSCGFQLSLSSCLEIQCWLSNPTLTWYQLGGFRTPVSASYSTVVGGCCHSHGQSTFQVVKSIDLPYTKIERECKVILHTLVLT